MFKKLQSLLVDKGPSILSVPLHYVPFSFKKKIIQQLLQLQFQKTLDDGELEFLKNHWVKIEVRDLKLTWFVGLIDNALQVSQDEIADVTFSAQTNDLILIASRHQDPDTLFFQRRLTIKGDTELGLCIKNMMDAFDVDSMPKMLRLTLEKMADLIENTRKTSPGFY